MQSSDAAVGNVSPSSRWTSYDGWDYNGMKERLESFMHAINKQSFVTHTERLLSKTFRISDAFSAGQHWACFELKASDGSLVIARARLPRHPSASESGTIDDETYAMTCEVATLKFLNLRIVGVPLPRLYAYAAPGSELAIEAGCAYMLIQGFYGNTLEDVQFDICQLPLSQQEHIISQWTSCQVKLASMTFPQIGSICHVSDSGETTIGKLSSAPLDNLPHLGPFSDTVSFLKVTAQGRLQSACKERNQDNNEASLEHDEQWIQIGLAAFLDIVQNTDVYKGVGSTGPFHFNHMDFGTQNILVDDDFKFLAVIDWEFAQSAPWEVNHYPMPFPLVSSPEEEASILADPNHVAYKNVSKQVRARRIYRQGFRAAESRLRLAGSIADILESPGARIYGCFEKLGVFSGQVEALTREMIRLAFGHTGSASEQYLNKISTTLQEERQMDRGAP